MVNRAHPGSLYEQALSLAQDIFDTDGSRGNADKVCAVALHVADDSSVALFSGGPGYNALVKRIGGNAGDAKRAITDTLTQFLRSEAGGGFTDQQINHHGLDQHGRGAMNCAEPKVFYYITAVKKSAAANWILIPFNQTGGGLVYNPPCMNCRRWVYRHFHNLTQAVAQERGGPNAFINARLN